MSHTPPHTFIYVKYNKVLSSIAYLGIHEANLTGPSSWNPDVVQAGKSSYGRVIFYSSDKPNLGRIVYNDLVIENGRLIEILWAVG
jgi:hypothetical protein